MARSMLRFDMRIAAQSPASPADTRAAALDMSTWTDELGGRAAFNHYPMGGGAPPAVAWKSLELFARAVWPQLR